MCDACLSTSSLCPACRAYAYETMRGVCASRADTWIASLIRQGVKRDRPWPTDSAKMLAIARMKVADLTRDPELLEMFAVECARWAAKRWAELDDVRVPANP